MVRLSATNFGLVSALLMLYALIGSVAWTGPLLYAVVSLGGSAAFLWVVRHGHNLRLRDPNLFGAQMVFAGLVLFGGFALMPELAAAHLCNLFVTAIFGAVQFTPAQFRIAVALASAGAGGAIWWGAGRLGLPGEQVAERWLLWAYLTVSLIRFGHIAAHVGALRSKLRDKNQALERSLRQITHLADHDALTGALSRRAIAERLQRTIEGARPRDGSICVALIDLDHFKRINDVHGHAVGDEVLQQVITCVTGTLRREDSVGRWGGEEFVVLLPDCTPAGALHAMQRLHDDLAAYPWASRAPGLRVTASIGLAAHRPGETPQALLQRADEALFAAKAAGRGRTVVAEEPAPARSAAPDLVGA
jgi:diguanylate cyclase (GGDEF)-like protein